MLLMLGLGAAGVKPALVEMRKIWEALRLIWGRVYAL